MVNLQKGLVGHWTMDDADTSGGTLYDRSAYDNHANLSSSIVTGVSGRVGEAYTFDGTSASKLPTKLSYNTTNLTKVSVSTWYKSTDTADHILVSSDRNEYWRLGVGSDSVDGVQWTVGSSDMVSSAPRSLLQDGNWHHIVGVFDGSLSNDHKIYIDASLDSEANLRSSVGSGNVSYTHIGVGSEASSFDGGTGPNDWMDGELDDVRVYNRALSESEVSALYNMRSQKKSNVSPITDEIVNRSVNEKEITLKRDSFGSWICVQNYEHYGGTNPTVSPGDKFPQFPNGETTVSEIENSGENGELRHVDNISQYGDWNVDAVKLEATTTNHSRKINYYTTNQSVIDSIVNNSTSVGHSELKSSVQKYPDHTAFLPDNMASDNDNETDPSNNQIFGYGFPMYGDGSDGTRVHWATRGLGDRWEVDDYPGGPGKTTIHRVWIRTGLF